MRKWAWSITSHDSLPHTCTVYYYCLHSLLLSILMIMIDIVITQQIAMYIYAHFRLFSMALVLLFYEVCSLVIV